MEAPNALPAHRVLLVDDNPGFLAVLKARLLEESWLEIVGTAQSGTEAISRVLELWPDLVLMDISMPGMSGLEATQRIKSFYSPPQIILVTLHDDPLLLQAASLVGADGFVTKTELEKTLIPLLHQTLTPVQETICQ